MRRRLELKTVRKTMLGGLALLVLAGLVVDSQSVIWPFHNGEGDVGIRSRPGKSRQIKLMVRQRPMTGESDIMWEHNGLPNTGQLQHRRREGGVWETFTRVKPGDRITLHAFQITNVAELECWIIQLSDGYVIDHSTRDDAGSIRCYLNRL